MSCCPSFSEGYNVLVIPQGCVETSSNTYIGNMNIEEMLAKKIIDRMEYTGTACSPTMQVLKISIMNNPDVSINKISPMANSKILSGAYGVPKVLLLSSRVELLNEHKQKRFWDKLELPVLTQSGSSSRVVTTVTLYNAKTDEVLWSDVYYKNIDSVSSGNTNGEKLAYLNRYYDELIPRIFENIRDSKETHAIMVKDKSLLQSENTNTTTKNEFSLKKSIEKFKTSFVNKKTKENKTVISSSRSKTQSNLEMKEKTKQPNVLEKFKEVCHLKKTNSDVEIAKKEITSNREKEEKVSDKKEVKQKVSNEKIAKNVITERQTKVEKNNNTADKSLKKTIDKKIADYKAKRVEKQIQKTEEKVKKIVEEPTEKVSLKDRIKKKYLEFKNKHQLAKQEKMQIKENNIQYSTQVKPDEDNTSEATKSLQTKPRNNSRVFAPKFDNTVNEI